MSDKQSFRSQNSDRMQNDIFFWSNIEFRCNQIIEEAKEKSKELDEKAAKKASEFEDMVQKVKSLQSQLKEQKE